MRGRIGSKVRDLEMFALSFDLGILGLGTSTEKIRLTKN